MLFVFIFRCLDVSDATTDIKGVDILVYITANSYNLTTLIALHTLDYSLLCTISQLYFPLSTTSAAPSATVWFYSLSRGGESAGYS